MGLEGEEAIHYIGLLFLSSIFFRLLGVWGSAFLGK